MIKKMIQNFQQFVGDHFPEDEKGGPDGSALFPIYLMLWLINVALFFLFVISTNWAPKLQFAEVVIEGILGAVVLFAIHMGLEQIWRRSKR